MTSLKTIGQCIQVANLENSFEDKAKKFLSVIKGVGIR
jgi:hypothetical protein